MTEEVNMQESVIPASDASQEQETKPEINGSENGAEQSSQAENIDANTQDGEKPDGEKKPDSKNSKKPWYQSRINEITSEKYEAIERANRAEAERARLEQLIEAIRNGAQDGNANQQQYQPQVDVDRVIAERLAAERQTQSFNEACGNTYAKGKSEFDDFDSSLANFQMLGGAPLSLIEAANEMDGGHRVLHYLGNNLDEAAELLALPPVKQAIRMAEINNSLSRKKTTPVSKAPPPIKPLDATTKGEIDLSKSSIDDFMARRNAEKPIKR